MANQELLAYALSIKDQTIDWYRFRILPWNRPEKRPGLYLFINFMNGKPYTGATQDMYDRGRHHASGNSPQKFNNAIKKYGKSGFLFIPIYYAVIDTSELLRFETELISYYNSITNGYNLVASYGGIGPYGPAFSERLRTYMSTDAAREKLRETTTNSWKVPEIRERRMAGLLDALARPEVQAKRAAGYIKVSTDPKTRLNRSAVMKARWADPTTRAALTLKLKAAARAPARRQRQSEIMKKRMADPAERKKCRASAKATSPELPASQLRLGLPED